MLQRAPKGGTDAKRKRTGPVQALVVDESAGTLPHKRARSYAELVFAAKARYVRLRAASLSALTPDADAGCSIQSGSLGARDKACPTVLGKLLGEVIERQTYATAGLDFTMRDQPCLHVEGGRIRQNAF